MENKFIEWLLLFRGRVKNFFQKNYKITVPILKLIGGLVVFFTLENLYGYSRVWSSTWFIAIMIGLFIIIPVKYGYLISSAFILLNLTNVSADVAMLYFAFILIVQLLILRLIPKYSYIMMIVPVLFYFKIPCLVPILMGMFCGISSAIIMIFGIITYFFSFYVKEVVVLLNSAVQKETVVAFRKILKLMSQDRDLILTMFILCLVFIITYYIYKQVNDYAWYLAIVFGGTTYFILKLMQILLLESNTSIMSVAVCTILSVIAAVIIQFFNCVIDYSRSEKIQFEDDEYYYYVKIVPKISVQEKSKNVKKISTTSKRKKKNRE